MRQALPVPQRVMAVVLSVLFVFCPFAAYAAGETDAAADPVLLPIIMYHEVKPNKSGKDAIQPWEFEADLKWLADNGYDRHGRPHRLRARRHAAAGKTHHPQL